MMVARCPGAPVRAAIAKIVNKKKSIVTASGVLTVAPKKISVLVRFAINAMKKNLSAPVKFERLRYKRTSDLVQCIQASGS